MTLIIIQLNLCHAYADLLPGHSINFMHILEPDFSSRAAHVRKCHEMSMVYITGDVKMLNVGLV